MDLHAADEALFAVWRRVWRLEHLVPANLAEERARFLASETYEPRFSYPALGFDAAAERRTLEGLRDGLRGRAEPIVVLLERKIAKLLAWVALLEARGTPAFTERAIAYYGRPSPALLAEARKILAGPGAITAVPGTITSAEAASRLQKAAAGLGWRVRVRAGMAARANCVAPERTLYLREGERFSERDVEKVRVHELGVHATRDANGARLGWKLFTMGTAGYEATEEGLAALMERRHGVSSPAVRRRKAAFALAADLALRAGFREVHEFLLGHVSPPRSFRMALRVKRGLAATGRAGAFTKDHIYLKGALEVEKLDDASVERLFLGKVGVADLPVLGKLIPGSPATAPR